MVAIIIDYRWREAMTAENIEQRPDSIFLSLHFQSGEVKPSCESAQDTPLAARLLTSLVPPARKAKVSSRSPSITSKTDTSDTNGLVINITDNALKQLKSQTSNLEASPNNVEKKSRISPSDPIKKKKKRKSDSKNNGNLQSKNKDKDKDDAVTLSNNVPSPAPSIVNVKNGSHIKQGAGNVTDKSQSRRAGKNKTEKALTQNGSDIDQPLPNKSACSICGQEMDPGSKSLCKGCISKQKGTSAKKIKIDAKGEDAKPETHRRANSTLTEGVSTWSKGKTEGRSASLEMWNNSSKGLTTNRPELMVTKRTLTDLESQSKNVMHRGQTNNPETKQFDGSKRKQLPVVTEDGRHVRAVDSANLSSTSSQESCSEGQDVSSQEDQSFDSQTELVQNSTKGGAKNSDHSIVSPKPIEQRKLLQRTKTDSELIRQCPNGDESESEQEESMNSVKNWAALQQGKAPQRKTSSASMDTGRGKYTLMNRKEFRTRHDTTLTAKVKIKTKPNDKEKTLGDRRRSIDFSNSFTSKKTSSTSLTSDRTGLKKPFANLRSHTIIGGSLQQNKENIGKKDKKNTDEKSVPVENQGHGDGAQSLESKSDSPVSLNQRVSLIANAITLYDIAEESDGSCDDSVSEQQSTNKVNDTSVKKPATANKIETLASESQNRLNQQLMTKNPNVSLRDRPISNSKWIEPGKKERENFDSVDSTVFKDYPNDDSSDSNDEDFGHFQASNDQDTANDDSDRTGPTLSLVISESASTVSSKENIYFDDTVMTGQRADQISTKMDGDNDEEERREEKEEDEEIQYHGSIEEYKFSNNLTDTFSILQESPKSNEKKDQDLGYCGLLSSYMTPIFTELYGHRQNDALSITIESKMTKNGYDETDVDTGMAISAPANVDGSPPRTLKPPLRDEWGQLIRSRSNSSNDSSDDDNDNWYTAGLLGEQAEKQDSTDSSESIYFNGNEVAAKENSSDYDFYTGEVYDIAVNEYELGNDGNKSFNNDFIAYEFIKNNSQNNSVRQQIHAKGGPRDQDGSQQEDSQSEVDYHSFSAFSPSALNYSNNYNGNDSGVTGYGYECNEERTADRSVQSSSNSCYTEFNYDYSEQACAPPKSELQDTGYTRFTLYDSFCQEITRPKTEPSPCNRPYLKDMLFFDDDSEDRMHFAPTLTNNEQGLYFTGASTAPVQMSNTVKVKVLEDHKKNDYFEYCMTEGTKDFCNNNNNADNRDKQFDNWYTGSERNEEECKPGFEETFNTSPASWPATNFIPKNRIREEFGEKFFYNMTSDRKPFVSADDSVYACEPVAKKVNNVEVQQPKVQQQLFKVGGIVVRNNVQDDSDYAKNINMDLQEEPRPYVRYDICEQTVPDVSDQTSYERNVVYDDFTTSRPWEEDDRAPWRISRGQNCGFNMEKSLKGAYDIKKTEQNNPKGKNKTDRFTHCLTERLRLKWLDSLVG